MRIEQYIDHTLLKAEASSDDIINLCREASKMKFYAVCVNPFWVSKAKEELVGSDVKIASVAGFPLGANKSETKFIEAKNAIDDGADEIDMVINIGMMKSGEYDFVAEEIKKMKKICDRKILKVIVETCVLKLEEKKTICSIVIDAGADFIKTSTGFSSSGALRDDVELFNSIAKGKILIKASGGIRDYKSALEMINSGASRIGTSSSLKIMEESNVYS